jgi:hypothetical protein
VYKKISFRSVSKPGRETAPGFSLGGRGAPQKRLGFLRPRRRGPKRKRFLAAASPHPKPQNQQRSEENAPISERPKRKSGRPPDSRNRATSMVQNLLEGAAENIAKRAAQLAEEGNVAAIRICMNRLSPLGQHNPVGKRARAMSGCGWSA